MSWLGLYPPQAVYSRKKFRKIILNPPNFSPGSWCGAGKMWIDKENGEYWFTSRPREGGIKRGFAVEIYKSNDGENFHLVNSIPKEELSMMIKKEVQSIENQQLLKDPLTNRYHLYLSLDVSDKNVAGDERRIYESKWETFLLTSDDPAGPWSPEGFVLKGDMEYDSGEARDSTIDIIDGYYFCLYKARRIGSDVVKTALALSVDGKRWRKLGVLKVDGKEQPNYFLLNGSILAGVTGPIFFGTETVNVINGVALTKKFVGYHLDYKNVNLEPLFSSTWTPGSCFEHKEFPIHTYCQVIFDTLKEDRWLIWIEAVDPTYSRDLCLNSIVDRVLLYISPYQ